jgi:glutamyl-tRNA reductase
MNVAPAAIQVIGINHQQAPLDVRDKIALNGEALAALRARVAALPGVSESLVLHTCNRIEIYWAGNPPPDANGLRALLGHHIQLPHDMLAAKGYAYCGEAAIAHVFGVAAGIDSQIVGETEIMGQMKTAYDAACAAQSVGSLLHRLMQKTFQAAKWARTHTRISQGQVSLGNVAVDLAQRIFGPLGSTRTMVVGTGDVARDVAKALHSRGVTALAIAGRNAERATAVANAVAGHCLPFESWHAELRHCDIAVFATASPGYLLTLPELKASGRDRPHRPLFLIDLAVPRDVDPAVAAQDGVFLYNLDDLAAIANENLASRASDIELCRREFAARAATLAARLTAN